MFSARLRAPTASSAIAACSAALAVLLLPAVADAGPLKATSFVRGTAVAEGTYPGALRSFAGDVDADGKDDVIFGNGKDAWLVYGTSPSTDLNLGADLGARGWKIAPAATGVTDVDAAGDFDNDGVEDALINTNSALYVVYGSRTRRTAALDLASAGSAVTKINMPIYSAGEAAGIGDFNGDGYDDVVAQQDTTGLSIAFGGPRVATIDGTKQGTRASIVKATQRCAWFWFSYRCTSLGVNFDRVGDFDGDGKDDLIVENSTASGNLVLYGRTGPFTVTATAGSGLTRLPDGQTGDINGVVGNYTGVGDVNGDGRGDVTAWGSILVQGRAGRPATIARSSSLVTLAKGGLTDSVVVGIGDQNGDGKGDLGVFGYNAGSPIRVVTSIPNAPATVNLAAGTPVAGLPTEVGMDIRGGGDLDGDGLGDLLVPSVYPAESTYLLTHGTGSPGGTARPASLEGSVRVLDGLGNPLSSGFTASLRVTCGGVTSTVTAPEFSYGVALGNFSENDDCTVALQSITIPNASAYAKCEWRDSFFTGYVDPLPAGASFKLAAGKNRWDLERRCVLPTTDYPAGFTALGWSANGSALNDFSAWIVLTDLAPNLAGSVMWASPLDWRNRTIEFELRMSANPGTAEGTTLAFVRPDASGQPQGGKVGGIGPLLGFGGLGGVAVAFDTKKDPGDPSSNFIGFTDGVNGTGGLRWTASASAVTNLRDPSAVKVKVINKNGTTTVQINGATRLRTGLAIPPSSFIAFTGATGATYQLQSLINFKTTAS